MNLGHLVVVGIFLLLLAVPVIGLFRKQRSIAIIVVDIFVGLLGVWGALYSHFESKSLLFAGLYGGVALLAIVSAGVQFSRKKPA